MDQNDRDAIICYYHDPIVFSFDLDIFSEKFLSKDVDIEIIADILVVERDHETNKSNSDINIGRFLDIDLSISHDRILSIALDASHHLEISMLQLFQRNGLSFKNSCSHHDSIWNVNIRYEAIDTYKNDEHDFKLYIFQYTWKFVQSGKRNVIMEQGWNILMKRPFITRVHSIYTYIKDRYSIERTLYNGFRMTSQENEPSTEISYYVIGIQIDSSAFDIIIQDIEWNEKVSLINSKTSWSFPILSSRFLMFFRIDIDDKIVKRTDIAKYLSSSLPSLRIKWQRGSRVITTCCGPISSKDILSFL